jgi:hypothetical protein
MQYAHGEFIITRCGDTVVTNAYGPWNKECVNDFAEEYRAQTACLHGQPWCDIVCVIGESLLIPDAETLLQQRIAAVSPEGLTHVALVMGESSVRTTTQSQLKRVYSGTQIEFKFVELMEHAVQWLSENGFTIYGEELKTHAKKVALRY